MEGEESEHERELIEKCLRHEDLIYFTFLISSLGILLSFVLSSNLKSTFTEIFIPLVNYVTIIIFFFSIIRFIGVVFESELLRYLSLHGLFCSLVFYVSFIIVPAFFGFSVLKLFDLSKTSAIDRLFLLLLTLIFLGIIFGMPILINRIIEDKLLNTVKYKPLRDQYGDKIGCIAYSFYSIFILLAIFIILCDILYESYLDISKAWGYALIICPLVGVLISSYYFWKCKKRKDLNLPKI